jgi:heme a synthase
MNEVELYNLEPLVELMAVGLAVAALPLAWWFWQQRRAAPTRRLKALTLITLFLTFDLVLFGAFTRLTDSGLGCPDWPGCYGSVTPMGAKAEIKAAETAMPTGPVTKSKAWIEMVHRYLATGVGVLILTLAAMTWWLRRHSREVSPWLPTFTLVWVCMQGAFGALTVTMKLFPAIVTLHLMGGIGLLALLMAQAVRYDGPGLQPLPAFLRRGLWVGFALIWAQIALGGWVSTNYAVLACPDFPTCNGQWVPDMNWEGFSVWRELGYTPSGELLPFLALSTIHFVHRSAAWLVLGVMVWLGWHLRQHQGLILAGRWLLGLSALQLITGLSNVVLGWPLLAAVLHTGGAAAMVVTLTWALHASRNDNPQRMTFSPRPAP